MNPVIENDIKEIVEHSEEDLKFLDGLKIFVAGATGFVGSWLMNAFAGANKYLGTKIDVTALTRGGPSRLSIPENEYVRWVADDYNELIVGIPKAHEILIDAVLVDDAPHRMFSKTMDGISRMIDMDSPVARIMYTSSGIVDHMPSKMTQERAAYAASKAMGEFMYGQLGDRKVVVVIPRLYSFMGPGLDSKFAVSQFMQAGMGGKDIEVWSPLSTRSYMYPTDMVEWLLAVLVRGSDRIPYNVGAAAPMSMIDVGHEIANLWGVQAYGPHEIDRGDYYVPAVGRAMSELGVEQRVSFEEGVRRWKEYLTTSLIS